jgi:hypothetical protein
MKTINFQVKQVSYKIEDLQIELTDGQFLELKEEIDGGSITTEQGLVNYILSGFYGDVVLRQSTYSDDDLGEVFWNENAGSKYDNTTDFLEYVNDYNNE